MKKISCCFVILICSIFTYAQSNRKLDSLKKVFAKLPKEGASFAGDTMRVKVLCEMAFHKAFTKPDTSIFWSLAALNLSTKINWEKGLVLANHQLGYSNIMTGKSFNAIEYLLRSLKDAEIQSLDSLIGVNNRQLGNIYYNLGKYEVSEKYYRLALPIFKKIGYKRGYANCLNDIGRGYFQRNQYNKAIELFQNCIVFSRSNELPILENYCTWSIVEAYIKKEEFTSALVFAEKGMLLNKINNEVLSLDWLTRYNNLSKIYLGLNQLSTALKYAQIAETYIPKVHDNSAYQIYYTLYLIYKRLNNTNLSLSYHEKYISLKDKAKEQDIEKQLRSVEYEYQYEKQKIKLQLSDKKHEQAVFINNLLLIGIGAVVFFVGVLWYNLKLLQNKNMQIENQKNEILLVKNKLEDLNNLLEKKVVERTNDLQRVNEDLIRKNQEITQALYRGQSIERKRVAVELHDNLGGTLSALRWRLEAINKDNLSVKEQKIYDGILNTMKNAYDDLRHISHNLIPADFEENGLFGAIKKLVDEINQSEKLKIDLYIEDGVEITNQKTALELYSICMELINNILKHSQASHAEVIFKMDKEKDLLLEIKDNGIGISNIQNNGVGMKNIHSRLEGLNAKYSILNSSGTTFQISVSLPHRNLAKISSVILGTFEES